jgi:hypothetical protein
MVIETPDDSEIEPAHLHVAGDAGLALDHPAFARDVGAGAKAAPGAGDQHRADAVVLFAPRQMLLELRPHRVGQRVELVRTVEQDGGDGVGYGQIDAHAASSPANAPLILVRRRDAGKPGAPLVMLNLFQHPWHDRRSLNQWERWPRRQRHGP